MNIKNKVDTSALEYPIRMDNEEEVIQWISEITSGSKSEIHQKLLSEFEKPGTNVTEAFSRTRLEPYLWNPGYSEFYKNTDAFLYELMLWNRNSLKRRMRSYIAHFLAENEKPAREVLCISDGLGIDSFYFAQAGHKVTYYEYPGYSQAFAAKLFSLAGADIKIVTDSGKISPEKFDVLICLDVLEHIPDVPAFIKQFTEFLRPGGLFFIHAPFYMVHPAHPTHLKINRQYSGNLHLFTQFGLRLIGGNFFWNPLIFEKAAENIKPRERSAWQILLMKTGGFYLSLGRFSNLPFRWIDFYHKINRRWFESDRTTL